MSERSRKIYKYTKKMEKNVSPERMSVYRRKLDYYRSMQDGGGNTDIDRLASDLDKRRKGNMKLVNNYETLSKNIDMLGNAVNSHINNTLSMDEYSLFEKENESLKKEVSLLKGHIKNTDVIIDNVLSKTDSINDTIVDIYTQSIQAQDANIDNDSSNSTGVFGSLFG